MLRVLLLCKNSNFFYYRKLAIRLIFFLIKKPRIGINFIIKRFYFATNLGFYEIFCIFIWKILRLYIPLYALCGNSKKCTAKSISFHKQQNNVEDAKQQVYGLKNKIIH